MATEHSLFSSYREMLLEHLFAGEVMRHVWRSGARRLEILKPQVDDGGYDLVLEGNSFVRHIQLKATFQGSKVARFKVNTGLESKPSGCVIVLLFEQTSLSLGPFLWFGAKPGERLPDLSAYPIAKHSKGNAQGIKLQRPNLKVVPRSAFQSIETVADVTERLFGKPEAPCTSNANFKGRGMRTLDPFATLTPLSSSPRGQ